MDKMKRLFWLNLFFIIVLAAGVFGSLWLGVKNYTDNQRECADRKIAFEQYLANVRLLMNAQISVLKHSVVHTYQLQELNQRVTGNAWAIDMALTGADEQRARIAKIEKRKPRCCGNGGW